MLANYVQSTNAHQSRWKKAEALALLVAEGAPGYSAVVVTGTNMPPDGVPLFRQHITSCPESRQAAQRRRREAPRCDSCEDPETGISRSGSRG